MNWLGSSLLGFCYFLIGAVYTWALLYPTTDSLIAEAVCIPIVLALLIGTIGLLWRCLSLKKPALIIPASVGLVLFLIAMGSGGSLGRYEFDIRRSSMESFLQSVPVTDGWLSSANGQLEIPRHLKDFVFLIRVNRSSANHLKASFEYGGKLAMHHSFWYYDSQGAPPEAPHYKKLDACWYVASG